MEWSFAQLHETHDLATVMHGQQLNQIIVTVVDSDSAH